MQLHHARKELESAGVSLTVIGQATPRQAAHFRRRMGIDLPVLADERRESYRAAGAKIATAVELLGPRSVGVGAVRTVRSGGRVRQGRTIGHSAQLGGTLLITPDGRVAWSHMSEDASDNAGPKEILEAARAAASTPG